MNWHLPFEQKFNDDRALEEMPRYQFVTNFYQGFGLSFVAVLSQDVPSVRFYPQSAQSLVDIAAARAASDVSELVEQNNHVEELLTAIGRYVADGQRFGFREEEIVEAVEGPLGEDVWVCPQCGKEGAATGAEVTSGEWRVASEKSGSLHPGGQRYTPASGRDDSYSDAENTDDRDAVGGNTDHGARDTENGFTCPACGAELGEKDYQKAERVMVPRVVETRRVANGQEVISIVGGLELNTPVWANEMHEFPYLQWQAEVHRAKLKAAYPWAADKNQMGGPSDADDI